MPLPKSPLSPASLLDDYLSQNDLPISQKKSPPKVSPSSKKSLSKSSQKSAPSKPKATCTPTEKIKKTASTVRSGRVKTPSGKRKLFVLDTNILLHDPLSIFRFEEHDVFLPMTTLEELDNKKSGTSDVARNARSVSRELDQLTSFAKDDLSKGIALNSLGNIEAKGHLFFETEESHFDLPDGLPQHKADNQILATVKGIESLFPKHSVVMVSKDINIRLKANILGIPAEDYFNDKVLDDSDMVYTGKLALEENFWDNVSDSLESWQDNGRTHFAFSVPEPSVYSLNQCLWIPGDESFMGQVIKIEGTRIVIRLLKDFRNTSKHKVWGLHALNMEQNMALNFLMDPEIDIVTLLGQAGTGKTLLTLAAALTQTLDQKIYSEIIVTRATVSVGEEIGFLPGTEEEKMQPWMGALEDNLEVLTESTENLWEHSATMEFIRAHVRVKSMSFMRGRTFMNKFLIIDEAQNLSPKQMKTLITRAGPGTKIVCLGNISQIDTPYLTEGSSGLTYVVERFQGWAHNAHITLERGERSRLAEFATEVL